MDQPSQAHDHGSPVIEAAGLTRHFRVRGMRNRGKVVHAADDVSFTIHEAEVLALVGESGSGKSTVAKMLSGLIEPTGGEIRLDGRPVRVRGRHAYRRYVGEVQMIFQDPFASLNGIHTVRYTLSRAVRIHHRGLRPKEVEARVLQLLKRVQLDPPERWIDKFPHELSGGQRQRVAIARALAAEPRVLLADEPISMLDVSMRLGILNLLQSLRDEERIAILYITHDVASARYFADRTVVLYAGRVVEEGDSEQVIREPAHPYTQLLIASAPDPDRLEFSAIGVDAGEAPSLIDPPSGCRFHPRCPLATDQCRQEMPPAQQVSDRVTASCWRLGEQTLSTVLGQEEMVS
ncbi:ABC transporter ATP-binding protein [Actinomyces urogenitalis]|uniref:ABC transporter ATP-binding protein n=1 Tax=Actinomyces urogenitalis TaxID=103621 RepID=UPI00242F1CAE|nr:ABC transporter ATP-binding protein [Actinomyces urogenitalis]MCI7456084.1 ABC transporter ATP-binding protein [Actinomyces urogenitalis]